MDEYSPFLSQSDLSSFVFDETTPSDKNVLSAENSGTTLNFNPSICTLSKSLDNSTSVRSDSNYFEVKKLNGQKIIPKCTDVMSSFRQNSFDIFDSQIKTKERSTIHKSDTFHGTNLKKKEIFSVPITNNAENFYLMEPKYYSTPIHFNNFQLYDKKFKNQVPMIVKNKPVTNYNQVMIKNQGNTRTIPINNIQPLKRENPINYNIPHNNRVYPSNLSTPNQYLSYDSRVFSKNIPQNYQPTYNRLNIAKQQLFLESVFDYNIHKTSQNQTHYPSHFQTQYDPNHLNMRKFPDYNFTNWTNYLVANNLNNLYHQNFLSLNGHSFMIPNTHLNTWFIS